MKLTKAVGLHVLWLLLNLESRLGRIVASFIKSFIGLAASNNFKVIHGISAQTILFRYMFLDIISDTVTDLYRRKVVLI